GDSPAIMIGNLDVPRSYGMVGWEQPVTPPFYLVSQPTIVRVTRSEASCCTKWPAPGTVTRVKSLSTQLQVSLRAPGRSDWSVKPWIRSTGHLTLGNV